MERYLREAAARFGARYISPMETLCNTEGCLVQLGDEPGDLMQFDDNHLTVAGSKFFVRSIGKAGLRTSTTFEQQTGLRYSPRRKQTAPQAYPDSWSADVFQQEGDRPSGPIQQLRQAKDIRRNK